ncbi:MAG: DUF1572 family protein [Trueperaceae bacterium]
METGEHVLMAIHKTLTAQKRLAERALEQLDSADFHWTPDSESNSIAIIVKHVAGNMRSRWTDFLTSDGEKPDRNRDGEFIDDLGSAEQVLAVWEEGWERLFDTLATLTPEQLQRTVTVVGREHTVTEALLGQLGHYAQHVGQIVYLAKLRLGERWQTVSIPRRRA